MEWMNDSKPSEGLTLKKILEAREILNDASVPTEDRMYYCPHVDAFRTGACPQCSEALKEALKNDGII